MITGRKAKALLAPGDTVFSTDGKRIVECVVQKICADSVLTDKDVFFFDEHGYTWWLTRHGVMHGGMSNE